MKRILFALSALIAAVTFYPKPADARVVVVFNGPGYYAPGYYWGPNGTSSLLLRLISRPGIPSEHIKAPPELR
jgi:hypothetical protein